ncbi:MAG: hypothetical protein QM426_05120 [Euryarchaeota archaeon]|nr:hypothetical protein [Euryarchaeota archaeon]
MDIRKKFAPCLMDIIQSELNEIEPRFKEEIMLLLRSRGTEPNRVPLDFHLYYPFWLSYNFEIPRKKEVVEELVKFNLWFSYHIFVQDDIIDKKLSQDDLYRNIIYSDYFLLKATLQLGELMKKLGTTFNRNVLKIYGDYIHCILWEKDHMKSMNVYSEKDIKALGNKFSPLKINNIVFTCLCPKNLNQNYLNDLNLFLENYHISMQLIDDIKDWKDDLKNENFSFFLMEIIQSHDMYEKINNIEEFERIILCTDIAENIAKKSLDYLYRAQSNILNINNPFLNGFIKEGENFILLTILRQQRAKESIIHQISQLISNNI